MAHTDPNMWLGLAGASLQKVYDYRPTLLLPRGDDPKVQWSAGQDATCWGVDPALEGSEKTIVWGMEVVPCEWVKEGEWFIVTQPLEQPPLMAKLQHSLEQTFAAKYMQRWEEALMKEIYGKNIMGGEHRANWDAKGFDGPYTCNVDPHKKITDLTCQVSQLELELHRMRVENAELRRLVTSNVRPTQDLKTAREMIDMQGRVADMLAEQVRILFSETNSRGILEDCKAALEAYEAGKLARVKLQEHFDAPYPAADQPAQEQPQPQRPRETVGAVPVVVKAVGHGGPGQAPAPAGMGHSQLHRQVGGPYRIGAAADRGITVGSWDSLGKPTPLPIRDSRFIEHALNQGRAQIDAMLWGIPQRTGFLTAYIDYNEDGPWPRAGSVKRTDFHTVRFCSEETEDILRSWLRWTDRVRGQQGCLLWRIPPKLEHFVCFDTGKVEYRLYARYAEVDQKVFDLIMGFDFAFPASTV